MPLAKNGALVGTRTPNLLIRSQTLYPLSYECLESRMLRGGGKLGRLDELVKNFFMKISPTRCLIEADTEKKVE